VLQARSLSDVDGERQPGGSPDAVLQPHRADADVLDRDLLRRFECATRRRRLSEVEGIELGRGGSRREQRIAADLPRGVGCRPDSGGRVERFRHRSGGSLDRQLGETSYERLRNGVSRCFQPCEVGLAVTTFEPFGARAENGRGRRDRFSIFRPASSSADSSADVARKESS
jgi:hypothetical protein